MTQYKLSVIFTHIFILIATLSQTAISAESPTSLVHAQNFFRDPPILGASLSPNGRLVAVRGAAESGRITLTTVDISTLKPSSVVSYSNADVLRASWLNDTRLLLVLGNNSMSTLVGENDALTLKKISPLENATKITQPLLLAHGEEDQTVPFAHALKLYKAIKSSNQNVEWVTYSQNGRESPLAENRIDFWTRVDKFLKLHIGEQKNAENHKQ